MSSKPTLIFVPGAWHKPSIWTKLTSILEAQQYRCTTVTLPSTTSNSSATFLDDINAVRNSIIAESTEGRDVVLIAHSYGGQVANSAIKGLASRSSSASTTQNHLIGLILIASGFTNTGVGFLEALGGTPPPFYTLDYENGYAVLTVDSRQLFYHDLSADEGEYWVSQLGKQSLKSLMEGGESSYAGWMDVPVWYLITTDDHTHPTEVQRYFVQMAREEGGDITTREVASSHSPMLSRPTETVDFILEAVASFIGTKIHSPQE